MEARRHLLLGRGAPAECRGGGRRRLGEATQSPLDVPTTRKASPAAHRAPAIAAPADRCVRPPPALSPPVPPRRDANWSSSPPQPRTKSSRPVAYAPEGASPGGSAEAAEG
ncbi:unnamed protein product [Callosobruchus maculatus]|uniref:Uncharacterized protein n=1 Tax=Callosobruchus maculatus TaxID=64391 RepID=A0A653D8H3_CALMS|nr:unnamed protein product [Callosobruchus maculatus]